MERSLRQNYRLKDGKVVTLATGGSELVSILHDKVEDYDGIKSNASNCERYDRRAGQAKSDISRACTHLYKRKDHNISLTVSDYSSRSACTAALNSYEGDVYIGEFMNKSKLESSRAKGH